MTTANATTPGPSEAPPPVAPPRRPRWFWLKRTALALLCLVLLIGLFIGSVWWYLNPSHTRENGIVYGKRGERNLTLDILKPGKPNGLGIALMNSGGWKSGSAGTFDAWKAGPLLRQGYTVFVVCHISQPRATVMEIFEDVQRSIRFIRLHAQKYGIDPSRIGVTGGSAGGHLSLMLATRGGPGKPDSTDPVERQDGSVQAVAIFFPVTDLLNLGQSTENMGNGGPPRSFIRAFGPQSTNLPIWKVTGREMSPIYHITTNMPPVLIYHGDADTLTPLEQSEWFQKRAREVGCTVDVVVHSGGRHGWVSMILDTRHFGAWFEKHLRPRSG